MKKQEGPLIRAEDIIAKLKRNAAPLNAKRAMFAWNPKTDEVEAGPWPDQTGWSRKYKMTSGACYSFVKDMSADELKAYLFIEAVHLIIRDQVDADAVHREFYKIREYREGLSEDFPKPSIDIKTAKHNLYSMDDYNDFDLMFDTINAKLVYFALDHGHSKKIFRHLLDDLHHRAEDLKATLRMYMDITDQSETQEI